MEMKDERENESVRRMLWAVGEVALKKDVQSPQWTQRSLAQSQRGHERSKI